MDTRRVLVFGDDGSTEADVAWLWVVTQRWPGWRAEVLEAHPPAGGVVPEHERVEAYEWTPPTPRPAFAESGFEAVTHLRSETDPRLALTRRADLLVVGPRGTGVLKALHLGSTTEWLLVHPPSPLLIARHGRRVRKVLVAADGSVHSKLAATTFAELPWASETEIVVLSVDDDRTAAEQVAEAAGAELSARGLNVRTRAIWGRPTAELLAVAEQEQSDLLVLGTRGLTGWSRLRLGSTAAAVARGACCSVLVAGTDD
ncbi:MAG: universal stress protein [Ilumatobacteraceae bacterium]